MHYGVYLPNFGAFGSARVMADLAQDAENAGWDGFFVWDHIARPFLTDVVDPWVALTAAAMTTKINVAYPFSPKFQRKNG